VAYHLQISLHCLALNTRIIGFDIEQGVIVKEYSEGLTIAEIEVFQNRLGLSTDEVRQLKASQQMVSLQLADARSPILELASRYWQEIRGPKGPSTQQSIVDPLDNKPKNFIFDFKNQTWVFFDP
jgi:hypothetical protein